MKKSDSFAKVMTKSTNGETEASTTSKQAQTATYKNVLNPIRQAAIPNMVRQSLAIEQNNTIQETVPAVTKKQKKTASPTKNDTSADVTEQKKEINATKNNAPASIVEQKKEANAAKNNDPVSIVEQKKETNAAKNNSPEAIAKHSKQPPTLLGQISKENPTVSDVMINSGHLGDKSWEIIHAQINRDKPYTKLPEGTKIFLDRTSNELFLRGGKKTEGLPLGTLNRNTPTISHLLASSQFDKEKWKILSLPVNANKDFRHIPAGSEVRIDPQTKEISWGKDSLSFSLQPNSFLPDSSRPAKEYRLMQDSSSVALQREAKDLSTAVQKFIGTPYSKMDCYGLVVKGLENIGVQYGGKEGLYNRLTSMAKEKGLPANAYLTGEGLVEAAGSKVLYENFPTIKKPGVTAEKTLKKMSRLLEKGQILSFSTPTRGHTGIISKKNDGEWTFINSGYMDHSVNKPQTRKGVGEEGLLAELTNWFTLASKRKEPLTVTLGKVDLARMQKQQESSGTLLASI